MNPVNVPFYAIIESTVIALIGQTEASTVHLLQAFQTTKTGNFKNTQKTALGIPEELTKPEDVT